MNESEFYAKKITDAELGALADAGEFFLTELGQTDNEGHCEPREHRAIKLAKRHIDC